MPKNQDLCLFDSLARYRQLEEQDVLKTLKKVAKHSEKEVNNRPLIGVLSQVSKPSPSPAHTVNFSLPAHPQCPILCSLGNLLQRVCPT